jgi:hypothetical protein
LLTALLGHLVEWAIMEHIHWGLADCIAQASGWINDIRSLQWPVRSQEDDGFLVRTGEEHFALYEQVLLFTSVSSPIQAISWYILNG